MKQSLIFIILLLSLQANSQDFNQELVNKLNLQIEQYVEGISPGIAVGIVKEGKTVFTKNIGYSNLEHKVKINENTRFNIASNAKQFTALCILKLVQQNKLNLEDDIRKYLPELYPGIQDKIAISNLLTHTSGIRDVYDLWALKGQTWWELFIGNEDAIELLQSQTDLNFKPGTEYLYSNSNYILLTEIIKIVTDQKFSEFSKVLFSELGMQNTSFLTNYMAVIPNKARPYGNWGSWREYPVITEVNGDGALYTTIGDQLKWEQILQTNNEVVLTKKLINQSQARLQNVSFKNYGYGLMFGTYKGLEYSYHDGNTGAYNATFLRFPSKNISVVVMSNNGNVPTNYLAKQLIDIVLNLEAENSKYLAKPEKIEELDNFKSIVGNYKNDDGTIIKIIEKNGSLFREIYQREPLELINEKKGLFHYANNEELKINFTNIQSNQTKFTIYLSSQEPSSYYKLPSKNVDNNYKASINGRYFNKETDTEIVIEYVDKDAYHIIKNGRKRDGKLILKDYLRMMSSYEITVVRDKEGNVKGLNVKNGRIKNVIFDRT